MTKPSDTTADAAYSARYDSLRGRGIYITGGTSGIGAELVRAFAAQGSRVAFNGRGADDGKALCDEIEQAGHPRPSFAKVDVTETTALTTAIDDAIAQFGGIDVLVNNVGNDDRHDIETIDTDYFDGMVAVNLRPHVFAIQAVLPGMKSRGSGSIVNIGSISWMIKDRGFPVYATLKSASVGLTRSLARDLGEHRIRINHIAPGWVMTDKQVEKWLDDEGQRKIDRNQCLNDRLMPIDVAAMCLFLAADDSRMITAQDFVVDAGWS